MIHESPQKLLFFRGSMAAGITEKSWKPLFYLGFFELAKSVGYEQNSVSIALKPLYERTFFKVWSGADRGKVNQRLAGCV
jgi:hypothetical protein